MVITTVRVSDMGTPIGEVGSYVRFFKDDVILFGLPTATYQLYVGAGKLPLFRAYSINRTK